MSMPEHAAAAGTDTAELSCDGFLDGRVRAWQPRGGFRSGVDAVFLAAAVPAEPGQSTLELGCGAAVASLCLAARVPDLAQTGVELQPAYAALAMRNAAENAAPLRVVTADLRALPADLRRETFDHVLMNPPYYRREAGTAARDRGRDTALGGDTPLAQWLETGIRRLKPGGVLSLIQQADRLPEVLAALDTRLGAVEVLPLIPRTGRPAILVLLRARKGRRTPFRLLSPLTLHSGVRHGAAGDAYTPEVEAMLRHSKSMPGFAT